MEASASAGEEGQASVAEVKSAASSVELVSVASAPLNVKSRGWMASSSSLELSWRQVSWSSS